MGAKLIVREGRWQITDEYARDRHLSRAIREMLERIGFLESGKAAGVVGKIMGFRGFFIFKA
jgi:hypothetical protein